MEKLTHKQEEYLLLFAMRDGRSAGITAAAEHFHVAKPTAFRFGSVLEERGLIKKNSIGEIELTKEGWEYVGPILDHQQRLADWLVSEAGMAPNLAENEASIMSTNLKLETILAILNSKGDKKLDEADYHQVDSLLPEVKPGKYRVGFSILKKNKDTPSMGDKGFYKPAILMQSKDKCNFTLYPKQIEHRPFPRCRSYVGMVDRLWIKNKEVWIECKSQQDGSYSIPGYAVKVEDRDGPKGIVSIRVRASVNYWNMPESEADLVFNLESLMPVDD